MQVGSEFTAKDFIPRNCKLLGEYPEGKFVGLVWEDRRRYIYGFTVIGELPNEPAFSDESNPLTQARRLLLRVQALSPQKLVIDWRLRELDEMPEALMVQVVKKQYLRRSKIALVIHKDADPATASKLLKYVELKRSVPEAIEWLRLSQEPNSDQPRGSFPRWTNLVAGMIGIVTFLFFVALSAVSLFQHSLRPVDRFPAVVVLALGGAVSSGLFSGSASVNGPLPIPFAQKITPVQISVVGGVATLIVLLILGKLLFC